MLDIPLTPGVEDVLGQATRARLFTLLDELRRPAGTSELAERLAMHPNGVRLHLERMEEAGLVTRSRARQARGRPPDTWTIAPDARPGGEPPRAYRDLGRWLARAMGSGRVGKRGVEAIGREIGREIAPTETASTQARKGEHPLFSALAALGFQPSVKTDEGSHMTFCLGNCPYRDAVRESQSTICALHKGVTRGLLDVIEPRAKLTAFVPRDPDEAGCLIEVRRVGGGSAATRARARGGRSRSR